MKKFLPIVSKTRSIRIIENRKTITFQIPLSETINTFKFWKPQIIVKNGIMYLTFLKNQSE